jgi:DNA mismatch repair protein MutL
MTHRNVGPSETSRSPIAVLPDAVIDQIAAGEVVERPASVVKELVENSLDAGATDVQVEIGEGGLALVAVHDDGVGMDRLQAQLALQRHATSKIRSAHDLATVTSLGFRGEALPSIASVSRLELLTRPRGDGEGTRLCVTGGVLDSVDSAGRASGTSVFARDLFYNVPARRKFLKTAASESRRVAVLMTDLALSRPDVGFRYRSENRDVFNVAPASSLITRTGDLLGHGLAASLLELEGGLDYVELRGYLGRPDQAKAGRQRVFLFVNGRRIQDRALFHALTSGYGRYLPEGRFPVAVIHITVPPDQVDVNVHPAKAEVRFLHPRLVYDALYYATNRLLTGGSALASMSPGDPAAEVATPDDDGLQKLQKAAASVLAESRSPGRSDRTFWDALYRAPKAETVAVTSPPSTSRNADSSVSPAVTAGRVFFQFASVYVVAQAGDALFIMDQHTAHERVLFEAVLKGLHTDLTTTQSLLFPISLELDPESLAAYEAHLDLFSRVGFSSRPFGHLTVLLEGTPAVLGGKSPERYFRDILESLKSELRAGRDRLSAMAASFACRAAVKAGDPLNESEMAALFERLFQSDEPLTCPHGRPTVVRLSRVELDRKFGRA